ncbi:hypothetical protein [Nocardiopsis sp. YSL2]|uniref:hypothetical protein n=1 Tax=Nocardiopsis sp. YSL2 TaxID=2939492 RepID=UPI0026F416F6|nr:hypothetical protein [Nocardiopsis sp. YSL2]
MGSDPMFVITVTAAAAVVAVAATVAVIVWLMRHAQRPAAAMNRRLDDVRRSVERARVPRVADVVRAGRVRGSRYAARVGRPWGEGADLAAKARRWGRSAASRLRSGVAGPPAAGGLGWPGRAANAHPVVAVGALGAAAAVSFGLLYAGTETAPGSGESASPVAGTVPLADPDPLVADPTGEPDGAAQQAPRLSAATGTAPGASVPDESAEPTGNGETSSPEGGGTAPQPDPATPTPDTPPTGASGPDPGAGEGAEAVTPTPEPPPSEPSEPAEPPPGPGAPSPPGPEPPDEPSPPGDPTPPEEPSQGVGPSQEAGPTPERSGQPSAEPVPSTAEPSTAASPEGAGF